MPEPILPDDERLPLDLHLVEGGGPAGMVRVGPTVYAPNPERREDVIAALEARIAALEQAIQPAALNQALDRYARHLTQRTTHRPMIRGIDEQL